MDAMKGWTILAALLLLAIPGSTANTEQPEAEILDEIIAKVNGKIITKSDLQRTRESMIAELQRREMPEAQIEELVAERSKHFLRDRIDHLLLVRRAEELNISVDSEVSKYFANLMLQMKVATQEKFAQLVLEQTGVPFEDYKKEVAEGMLTQRVLGQEVGSKIVIPKEEVAEYYENHKEEFRRDERVFLQEILISTEGLEGDELAKAKEEAEQLVARARRGERFEELAREYSDAVTADNGGDLGGWKKGDLKKEIEDMIWDKERNHVTDIIETAGGFLILKVVEHHEAGIAHLEEVEQEIMGRLYEPRFQPKIREYLTELRQQAYLEIKEGYLDTAAAPGKDTAWTDPAELVPETVTREEVVSKRRRKKFLFIPIPGTKPDPNSSSK